MCRPWTDGMADTHDWKHYLPETSLAGGKYKFIVHHNFIRECYEMEICSKRSCHKSVQNCCFSYIVLKTHLYNIFVKYQLSMIFTVILYFVTNLFSEKKST